MSFPEKKSYNPHVNIEYVDDNGRDLTPKEVKKCVAWTVEASAIDTSTMLWLFIWSNVLVCLVMFVNLHTS